MASDSIRQQLGRNINKTKSSVVFTQEPISFLQAGTTADWHRSLEICSPAQVDSKSFGNFEVNASSSSLKKYSYSPFGPADPPLWPPFRIKD